MLDIKYIRDHQADIRRTVEVKRSAFDLDALLAVDDTRRTLLAKVEGLRAEMNAGSARIQKAPPAEKPGLVAAMKKTKETLKALEGEGGTLAAAEKNFRALMLQVPNPPLPEVPVGRDESENIELRTWGKPRQFDFEFMDHVRLMEKHDLVDFQRATEKISGSRTYFLKNAGALLELAVLNYTLQLLVKRGFTPFLVPVLVNYAAMMGTSYFPGGEEQAYHLDDRDDLYLIGTAEVPVTSYHMDEILAEEELPKKYCGLSNCFRREAGTYGKDTRGLYRIHQFQKVEQVIVCRADPDESRRMHDLILGNAEQVLQDLGLAYRVVAVCTGDMGQGQVYKHDIETWMPSRNAYGETHSCSSFYDFQARRLNMRYRDAAGTVRHCYTLNNTCIASPRILIPLLEVWQNVDSSITVPECLRPWCGGLARIG